jgi:AraC-like DNA-binding protein
MQVEFRHWQKRLLVSNQIKELLIPGHIALSNVSSHHYFHSGKVRKKEKNSAVFQYTLSGCGVFEVNQKKYYVDAEKAFYCIVADENIKYYYPKNGKEEWIFMYITFYDKLGITDSLNKQLGYVFDLSINEPLIKQMLGFGKHKDSVIEMQAGNAHVFLNSIIAMLVNHKLPKQSKMSSQTKLIKNALQLIESKIEIPYNASLLSNDLGISQEHLNRSFQSELRKSPYACICENKIHRACELLKNTNQAIATIAQKVGYDPGSHFARLFKRIIGETPSEYRNNASIPLKPVLSENYFF